MNKKVEFFHRLFKVLSCREDILHYLAEEKVIKPTDVQDILHQQHQQHASLVFSILDAAVKEGVLQLVDYEWTILPVERLCLTIVSNNEKKVFEWGNSVTM